jgi:hypothetical protein
MVLPELYGFSNMFAVSQMTNNLRSDPRFSLGFSFSSARRLFFNYMLAIQSSFGTEESNIEIGIDRICENNMHLKFTPISIHNWEFGPPKVGIEKSFNSFQFSSVTDFRSLSFDFAEGNHKKVSRSLKLYMEGGSIGLMPRI